MSGDVSHLPGCDGQETPGSTHCQLCHGELMVVDFTELHRYGVTVHRADVMATFGSNPPPMVPTADKDVPPGLHRLLAYAAADLYPDTEVTIDRIGPAGEDTGSNAAGPAEPPDTDPATTGRTVWVVVTFPDTEARDAARITSVEVLSRRSSDLDILNSDQEAYEATVDGDAILDPASVPEEG